MFITFEGIDFSGKSTQVKLLEKFLRESGKNVIVIREPGGTELSEKVREILLDKNNYNMSFETEIFLFSSCRAQLVREKIKPHLENGWYVISDRFHDSTTAYQGFGRGIDLNIVNYINKLAIGETVPDITFFIDIPVEEAERRKNNKEEEPDRIESSDKEFYEKVRKGYHFLAQNEKRFRLIDGTLTREEINNKIIKELILLEKKETL